MNTETERITRSKWLKVCLALASALLMYRVTAFVVSLVFLVLRRFPFPVIAFVHEWDYVIVPLLSVCAAVLTSRWQEQVLERKKTKTSYMTLVVVTLLASFPVNLEISAHPVMCSPLEIAIRHNYPMETVELLIDRHPRMINGREKGWDNFCPLEEAAYSGKTNLVELLVRKGANVDYAIERLMQMEYKEAVTLVLKCSKGHNQVPENIVTNAPNSQH